MDVALADRAGQHLVRHVGEDVGAPRVVVLVEHDAVARGLDEAEQVAAQFDQHEVEVVDRLARQGGRQAYTCTWPNQCHDIDAELLGAVAQQAFDDFGFVALQAQLLIDAIEQVQFLVTLGQFLGDAAEFEMQPVFVGDCRGEVVERVGDTVQFGRRGVRLQAGNGDDEPAQALLLREFDRAVQQVAAFAEGAPLEAAAIEGPVESGCFQRAQLLEQRGAAVALAGPQRLAGHVAGGECEVPAEYACQPALILCEIHIIQCAFIHCRLPRRLRCSLPKWRSNRAISWRGLTGFSRNSTPGISRTHSRSSRAVIDVMTSTGKRRSGMSSCSIFISSRPLRRGIWMSVTMASGGACSTLA